MTAKPNPVSVVIGDVLVECQRLDKKTVPPGLADPLVCVATLVAAVGQVSTALETTDPQIYRRALVKLAATAVFAVEAIDTEPKR